MKLSTRSRYCTRILVELASHDNERASLGELAREQQISHSYVEHAITPLIDAGILTTFRGFGGGICLARPANSIRVSEIVRLLEGDELVLKCINTPAKCIRSEKCATRGMWQRVEQAIFAVLDSITLLDLVEQMARNNCPEISPDME